MKNIFFTLSRSKSIMLLIALGIVSIILWNTYQFFKGFEQEEIIKMELLSDVYHELNQTSMNEDVGLMIKIIENNKSIPMIVTDSRDSILIDHNIDYASRNKKSVLQKELIRMKGLQPPIIIDLPKNNKHHIYYAHSKILENLRFYPLLFIVIFAAFVYIIFAVFNSDNLSEKNKLWSGMAKETAHQIGTPLSSLLGWIEILRSENVNPDYISEIEKDVDHLNIIAQRFSKIGSIPNKESQDLVTLIQDTIQYFTIRSSQNLNIIFTAPQTPIITHISKDLFSWVLENIIKNGIDAMQGKGEIKIELEETTKEISILISDTGKGIPRRMHKKIFEPGYTTKTRGWGLGLSLTRRIVQNYHQGKVFVKESKKDMGTTFQINIPKKA